MCCPRLAPAYLETMQMSDMTEPSQRVPVSAALVRQELGIWGSFQASRRNVLEIIPEVATRQPIVSGRTGTRWHMLTDPEGIRHVLLDRLEDYPKSKVTKNLLRPAIGESLFIAEGAPWRWQRRTAAPAFSHRNVSALSPVMTAAAERSTERIAGAGRRAVNMLDEMIETTFDVIADVTFSSGDAFDRAEVHRAIDAYVAEAGRISLFDIMGLPDWVPRPGRMTTPPGIERTREIADKAIADRVTRGPSALPDLLDLLLSGEDPKSGRRMSAPEIRDNLLTFIVAGHETTALTLSWAFYLMAFDQDMQARAHREARDVLAGRAATAGDLTKLPLIRRIIDETLRLYPPAGVVSRTAQRDDRLCGTDIRTGDTVIIPIYALHRHHALWEDPDAFRPDRWTHKPDRYAYLPFGDGPRICIGMSFALQEAVIILATLLSRFRFTPVKGRDPKPVMILTLRPEGGVWLEAEAL